MEKILEKKSLPQWLRKLSSYEIYAPTKEGDLWNFRLVVNPESVDLSHFQTVVSPKKIIFPQREVLLEFNSNEDGVEVREILPEEKPTVIFGVRPCDAKAIILTDKVFGGDFEDPYYWRRRKSTALVGLACTPPPSENCFCLSVDWIC